MTTAFHNGFIDKNIVLIILEDVSVKTDFALKFKIILVWFQTGIPRLLQSVH